jgi:uncharacterized protein GlcG (DUF336 family)
LGIWCRTNKGKLLMSQIAKTIAGLAIAAVLSSPATSQGVVTQKSISLPMAQTIANAVIAKCQSMGFKISVSVLDRGGLALVMLRDEGASLHTVESSDRKAYTARTFRQPSAAIVKRIQDEPAVAGFKEYTRVIALPGGLPIKIGDDVIGAVGVSGSPGKDDECAQAGIDKVADQLK